MIGSLRGEVLWRDGTELLVEVGGVGYRVQVSPTTAARASEGSELFLHVHHHIREDAALLYGFVEADERKVFETLIATHGVGPSMALAILSVHTPAALAEAVATEDTGALCLVPGVGKKTAARLLVELRSKLTVADIDLSDVPASSGGSTERPESIRSDVREALVGLGYANDEIAGALTDLPVEDPGEALREALRRLAVA